MAPRSPDGWAFPLGASKAHYFVDGRSLCGRWDASVWDIPANDDVSVNDCAECWAINGKGS